MEIELKYRIQSEKIAEAIWKDEELKRIEEKDSRSSTELNAVYFDTRDCTLLKNDIAYRVRKEGEKIISSLKWNGNNQGPLHVREELNIRLHDERDLEEPKASVFAESDIGKDVINLLGDKKLESIMKVNVLRKSFRVDINESLMEISIDKGEVVTENGSTGICEVEIELFSGEQEVLEELGNKLQHKYNLESEKSSKFAKGLSLLKLMK